VFYLSGEVNKPGAYRIERDMTLMQALAAGGGINLRGTEWGIRVYRRDEKNRQGRENRAGDAGSNPVR